MSIVVACPICGNSMIGPTSPPDVEVRNAAGTLRCNRCQTQWVVSLQVEQLGALVGKVTPMVTNKS